MRKTCGQHLPALLEATNGIPFWLQKDATTNVNGGFEGGNPAGFSGGAGGIDSDAYPRWRNWTFGYTNVTVDDLVKKVKKALTFTHFMPPVQHPNLQQRQRL